MFVTTGVADMLAFAKAQGIARTEAATLFDFFNPGATVATRAKRMLDGNYGTPSWELAMARKDARLMMEAAAAAGSSLSVLPSIAALMDRFIGEGHAREDWTIIART